MATSLHIVLLLLFAVCLGTTALVEAPGEVRASALSRSASRRHNPRLSLVSQENFSQPPARELNRSRHQISSCSKNLPAPRKDRACSG